MHISDEESCHRPGSSNESSIRPPSIISIIDDNFTSEQFEERFDKKERDFLQKRGFLQKSNLAVLAGSCGNPPPNHKYHKLISTICGEMPTKTHYEKASTLHDSDWILTEGLRTRLYFHLFVPTKQPDPLTFEGIIQGKIDLIRDLQSFMLHVVSNIKTKTLPNLQFLVDDAIVLLHILQTHVPSHDLQTYKEWHPFHKFELYRRNPWQVFGFSDAEINEFWQRYQDGLCDALFGLWHPADQSSFLQSRGVPVRCILSCLDLTRRQSHLVPELDCEVLDAAFIVAHGPFRFRKTDYLHEHLSTDGKTIFVFTEWQKLAGMRHHRVLRNPEELCMFDIMTSHGRYTPEHTTCIRSFLSRLHYSVQSSLFLLFFQKTVKSNPLSIASQTSVGIAKNLGIEFMDTKAATDLAYAILDNSTWETFLDRTKESRLQDPFMVPLDKLYKTLTMWKPRTFWEMRHTGYGNVDVVQLYGFYFGIMVGVAGVLALAMTAAQTYAGFKALHP